MTVFRRPAADLGSLATDVRAVVSRRQWRVVRPLFERIDQVDGPFEIPAADAARMAVVLDVAAQHPDLPSRWREDIEWMAMWAGRFGAAGQPWRWLW